MKNLATAIFAVALLVCLLPATSNAVVPYSQDFEGLTISDVDALGNDGWLVYGNVFDGGMNWLYGYGAFPAPNNGAAFSAIVAGEGGAEQGAQQLVIFSDYENGDHANGNWIEANVFQEQMIDTGNVGEIWMFDFDAKMGNLEGGTTALAFIKTLDPNAGYATTNYITLDMTSTPATWTGYTISLEIDAALDGQIFQIGFSSTATNYEGSGVFYDNINLSLDGGTATAESTWSDLKQLY